MNLFFKVLPLSNIGNDIPPMGKPCVMRFSHRRRFPDLDFPIGGGRLPGQGFPMVEAGCLGRVFPLEYWRRHVGCLSRVFRVFPSPPWENPAQADRAGLES